MKCLLFLFLSSFLLQAFSQEHIKGNLNWEFPNGTNSFTSSLLPRFKEAQVLNANPDISVFSRNIELPSDGIITTRLKILEESTKSLSQSYKSTDISPYKDYKVISSIVNSRNKYIASIELIPIKFIKTDLVGLIQSFEIEIQFQPKVIATTPTQPYTYLSELSSGQIFKISVSKKGIYKLDKSFFENKLKIKVSGVNPKNIRLLGNGGTRLPESNSISRTDDLKENKIYFSGQDDGIFNDQDYILFYANGPDEFSFDTLTQKFTYDKNSYSSKSFYFIKFDVKPGLRINKKAVINQTDYNTSKGYDFYHHENDLINLLDLDECNHGSGQKWYGEELSNTRELDLSNEIDLQSIDLSTSCKVSLEFASRASANTNLNINIDGSSKILSLGASPFSCTSRFASNNAFNKLDFKVNSSRPKTIISFPQTGINSDGWLDYFQISYIKDLQYNNHPEFIFDPQARYYNNTRYNVKANTSINDYQVWNITDPTDLKEIPYQKTSNGISYVDPSTSLDQRYLLFSLSNKFESAEFESIVENQNLHELDKLDLVIIYHASLKREAERLLKHRTGFSKLTGMAIDIDKVSNEFGSGTKDPTAIRDFMRMLHSRNPQFKYLVLFGNGSFDYRHLALNTKDQNLVPTYETKESLDPILSFPSDDYFGLLDDNEGIELTGGLDIEIGRILSTNIEDATTLVDKIIKYDIDVKVLQDWKLNLLFMGDDEDGNTHVDGVDQVAREVNSSYPIYNQQKVYLDAYEQISTPGGERYPEVNKAITDDIFKGALVATYLGHGGPTGLAQERVLQDNDIKNWDCEFKTPLLITATCSFSPFDDPRILSVGQLTQIQKNGTIALLSTVRAVYADQNLQLTKATFESAFEKTNSKYPTLGDIILTAKNKVSVSSSSENSRKYFLFGDPSQKLAYPKYEAEVSSINDKPLTSKDTFKALQKINIKGIIKNELGQLNTNFNGLIYVTIFDKAVNLKTRANNTGSTPFSYTLQKNIIFKGTSEVVKGNWSVDFIIPKDINYTVGAGKISLYASNLKDEDAAGFTDQFLIGGFVKDAEKDDQPPVVKLFINNSDFVNGGITNENPKIYAELSDDFGINITGNSIGHDLIAILDNKDQNPILLNTFFNAKVNDYREGNLNYPLKNLSVGKHTLSLTAWDISNNRGIGNLEFNVISSDDVQIEKVYNYPNPFNKKTNFQFETNYINLPLEVSIQIQSLSGKVVKTIYEKITPGGYRISSIEWDGRDDLGNELANGVYLYRVGLYSSTKELILNQKSNYQKLVILR